MELGDDHQSLMVGQWPFEDIILQLLFRASPWVHEIRELFSATQNLHQSQVKVVELLD